MMNIHNIVGDALTELVNQARNGAPKVIVGLMASGNEVGIGELLNGAVLAMEQDVRLQVVAIGEKVPGYENMEWIETSNSEPDIVGAMESAIVENRIDGAVALHYGFPMGVTTIGRAITPARGKPMLIASCTGMAAPSRAESMLRNALYGIAVAKALRIEKPTIGILNLDGANLVQRALALLAEGGYAIHFGTSIRSQAGSLLRGNDLLAGAVDICVCDTLTGNVLMKLLSAFNTGGSFEALGWGYGPSVGENWDKIVSIISRASGAPVVANALCYTASLIRGNLVHCVQSELAVAKSAGFHEIVSSIAQTPMNQQEISMPAKQTADSEIHGIDVLSIEEAVKELWKSGIYAESAMGCTGPVVKVSSKSLEQSKEVLKKSRFM